MNTFTADLDNLTAGMTVTRYINDDDEFNYVVDSMVTLGHDGEQAAEAMREWINSTQTWDCDACGLEGIESAAFGECPRCDGEG